MTKSNRALGFQRIHQICEGSGAVRGSLTADVVVGAAGGVYRAWCCLYHRDKDASREGVTDSLCARGDTPEGAMATMLERCVDQWTDAECRGVRRAIIEIQDSLDEDGEIND